MSYITPNRSSSTDDFIGTERNRSWFTSTSNPVRDADGLYEYCTFCLTNFRQFHQMMNNVCQSCGRPAEPVIRDKQENLKVTSLNDSKEDEQMQKAVSLEFDYSPLSADPTMQGYGSHTNERMQASSAGDAIRKINTVEQANTRIAAARLRNEKFLVKTNLSQNNDKVPFDSNA